jgi:O-acetyl-ADP-ribose deacetylase (regulator of RNase III)
VKDELEAIQADITTLVVDAIVNAANEPLIMGGGVDGAIRRKAGPEMERDLRRIGRCPTGSAVITPGYRLPARFVIHTVAPIWRGGDDERERLLASCYSRALTLADGNGIRSIAFPAIGTGAYAWPAERASELAFGAVTKHLGRRQTGPHHLLLLQHRGLRTVCGANHANFLMGGAARHGSRFERQGLAQPALQFPPHTAQAEAGTRADRSQLPTAAQIRRRRSQMRRCRGVDRNGCRGVPRRWLYRDTSTQRLPCATSQIAGMFLRKGCAG